MNPEKTPEELEKHAKENLSRIALTLQQSTTLSSETGRKLAFGAAAVAWAFKSDQVSCPQAFMLSMFFVAGFVFLDIVQNLVSIFGIGLFIRVKERAAKERAEKKRPQITEKEAEFGFPSSIVRLGYCFFFAKFPLLLGAYACLGFDFFLRFTHHK